MSPGNPYFEVKRSNVVESQSIAGVCLCTLVSAGFSLIIVVIIAVTLLGVSSLTDQWTQYVHIASIPSRDAPIIGIGLYMVTVEIVVLERGGSFVIAGRGPSYSGPQR